MIKFIKKLKNKNPSKNFTETDSVPEPPRELYEAEAPVNSLRTNSTHGTLTSDPLNIASPQNYTPLRQPKTFNSSGSFSSGQQFSPSVQLSVTNSHGFHIGEVHNYNISNGSVANFNLTGSGLLTLEKSLNCSKGSPSSQPNVLECLENNYDKIKDWEIILISESMSEDWRAFGRKLELTVSELNVIESKSLGDPKKAAMFLVQNYVAVYPDTSIGFISTILYETGNYKAVEQLAKLRL